MNCGIIDDYLLLTRRSNLRYRCRTNRARIKINLWNCGTINNYLPLAIRVRCDLSICVVNCCIVDNHRAWFAFIPTVTGINLNDWTVIINHLMLAIVITDMWRAKEDTWAIVNYDTTAIIATNIIRMMNYCWTVVSDRSLIVFFGVLRIE